MAEGWEAAFKADLISHGLNSEGNLTLTFCVATTDKYIAMPITDIRGKAFDLTVTTASKRVFAGEGAMAEAKLKIRKAQLKADRDERKAERDG